MKPITGPALCQLLEAAGWKLQRISGSHYICAKAGERKVLQKLLDTRSKPQLVAEIDALPRAVPSKLRAEAKSLLERT